MMNASRDLKSNQCSISSPHQVFHCAMCFKEVVENVILGFKDQSKGNDECI